MATNIPKKIETRLAAGIRQFQPVLTAAKDRDIGESDTVTIVKDMLADIFGYDKYSDVTAEHAIRGTYCDLALTIDGHMLKLIEVKAIGIELKDQHVKQAVDYATNKGCDWVTLTNGIIWRVYKIHFSKPIDAELVLDIDILNLNPKTDQHLEWLFLLCKEGWAKSVLGAFHAQKQVISRFFIGGIIVGDTVVEAIRRELRKLAPDVRTDAEQIRNLIESEILKRDVLEGERAVEARRKLSSIYRKIERQKDRGKKKQEVDTPADPVPNEEVQPDPVIIDHAITPEPLP